MAILNYTTEIDASRTIAEIEKCLSDHGAKKIIKDYDDNNIAISITFQLMIKDRMVSFTLPANYLGVQRALENHKNVPKKLKTKEQALRVSWRILKDWVGAQMAIVEAELAEMGEVFLPYAVTPKGITLYNALKGSDMKLLTGGQ